MANIIDWSETLESLFNKATNPENVSDDWDSIIEFCDQVNKSYDGPQHAIKLLVHKITSPQEKEALLALTVLESCAKNCGKRFHAEIGKFRFLNELIKVISPKYLGNSRSDKVKTKCIELMYSWSKGLRHETKVHEAYTMLKKQGIVKEDPSHVDKTFEDMQADFPPRPKNTIFDDQEKSKLLARLLKSKNPEDLQAANRLIKNMVKQESERQEKVTRRITELETVNNNIKLLSEMLNEYNPSTTQSERDVMHELYDTLEKLRPNLFRLAADTDEKDDSITEILRTNDEVMTVMNEYKSKVGLDDREPSKQNDSAQANSSSLLDFDLTGSPVKTQAGAVSQLGSSILDNDLAALGLTDDAMISGGAASVTLPAGTDLPKSNTMEELGRIFSSTTNSTQAVAAGGGNMASFPVGFNMTQQPVSTAGISLATTAAGASSTLFSLDSTPASSNTNSQPVKSSAFDELNLLSQSMLQKSLPAEKSVPQQPQPVKIPLNQLASSTNQTAFLGQMANSVQTAPPVAAIDTTATNSMPVIPVKTSPAPQPATAELLSLADVFVPLDTIKPGTVAPLTAYDKNGLKIVIHFGKDSPKPHILVMVVSIISTNSSPVKSLAFQAAVPKLMRVKLQPPSATDLPVYNPFLPPTAITQVMLLSNPQKEKIRIKFKLTYTLDAKKISDMGEVDNFPVQ
ncbi:ADP-ribosylation factor-binding protein GGA1-like isoform X2 [Tubulanus polymorphus]|uniref:ADP-ribosylation factor-binding protein GGA1-like isoform X2 n=1 Tax=Tubulanus polymorphus TaxID=672921 RepID=UPI003DA38CC0